LVILNLPDGPGAYEGPSHLKAKVKVATVLSDAGYTVQYEKQFDIDGLPHPFWGDIYLEEQKVVIEVDRRSHWSKRKKSYDRWKDSHLEAKGLSVIRLPLEEALGAPEQVLAMIPRPL
jgi:very-short-patch-repair endonuclease